MCGQKRFSNNGEFQSSNPSPILPNYKLRNYSYFTPFSYIILACHGSEVGIVLACSLVILGGYLTEIHSLVAELFLNHTQPSLATSLLYLE